MRIGFHVPTEGGWLKALWRARERRCEALQVFASAPVQWARRESDPAEVAAFAEGCRRYDIAPVFVHGAYLLNLASPDAALRARSAATLAADLRLSLALGAVGMVVHLGSIGGDERRGARREGLRRVARTIDAALASAPAGPQVVLENAAGAGGTLGGTYGEVAAVLAASRDADRLAVCLDTAHSFAAGYAWHTPEGLQAALDEAEREFGLGRVCLIHANDSRSAFGSHVDRHWHIGRGQIGRAGFRCILAEPRLRHLPFVMETPEASLERDLHNLRALRRCLPPEVRRPVRRAPRQPRRRTERQS